MTGILRSVLILGGTAAGVLVVTLALTGMVAPAPIAMASPSPTPAPSFDLAVAPEQGGGSLTFSGDRTGTLVLSSGGSQTGFVQVGDWMQMTWGPTTLSGTGGKVVFGRDPAHISQIDYDGLSFYLDPGDCSLTPGARNATRGLMNARVACTDISDIRGNGIVSVEGIVAVAPDALGDRGDLPPSGGSVRIGDATVAFSQAVESMRVPFGEDEGTDMYSFGLVDDTGAVILALGYHLETHAFELRGAQIDGEYVELRDGCPLPSEALGALNELATVVRIALDCQDVELPGGVVGSIEGLIVIDVINYGHDWR